jgi:hypothetical protein
MDDLPKSDLLRFVEHAVKFAPRAVDRYSSKYLKTRYTLRQHTVSESLRDRPETTLRPERMARDDADLPPERGLRA